MATNEDPELLDDETEGVGDDNSYDQKAVETIPYDHAQFELPEDVELEGDEDE